MGAEFPLIVDLKSSDVDWDNSARERGTFAFRVKKYIDYRGDKTARPNWVFRWERNVPYSIQDALNKWAGADCVNPMDNYWPEGGQPDAESHFRFKDTVLMKIPIYTWIQQRRKEMQQSEMAPKLIQEGLANEFKAHGVDLTPEELAKYLGASA